MKRSNANGIVKSTVIFVKKSWESIGYILKAIMFLLPAIFVAGAFYLSSFDVSTEVIVAYILMTFFFTKVLGYIRYLTENAFDLPVPQNRFTERKGNAIEIDDNRLYEMLVYMNDLENWLEENNMLLEE